MLIYGAPDYQVLGNNAKNLWAYCYWTDNDANKNAPTSNVFFWASYDFMYPEYAGGANTTPGLPDAHTYIHELGHCMGLEDYYDYNNNYYPL